MIKIKEVFASVTILLFLLLIGLSDPKLFQGNSGSAMILIVITLILTLFRRIPFVNMLWKIVMTFWIVLMAFFIGNYIRDKYFRK